MICLFVCFKNLSHHIKLCENFMFSQNLQGLLGKGQTYSCFFMNPSSSNSFWKMLLLSFLLLSRLQNTRPFCTKIFTESRAQHGILTVSPVQPYLKSSIGAPRYSFPAVLHLSPTGIMFPSL